MVRLQPRLDAGGVGSSHRCDRHKHHAGWGGRECHSNALHVEQVRQARSLHDGERRARGSRGHYSAVRIRDGTIGGADRWRGWGAGVRRRVLHRRQAPDRRSGGRDLGARSQRVVGILSVGLLADGTYGDGWNGVPGAVRGLFYGDASQLVAQLVGGLTNFVAVGAMAYAAYKVTELVVGGHRVSAEVEELGLDLPEMGALAYPDTPEVSSAVILSESAAVSLGAGQLEPEPEAI